MKPLTTAIVFSLIISILAGIAICYVIANPRWRNNDSRPANDYEETIYRHVKIDSRGYRDDEKPGPATPSYDSANGQPPPFNDKAPAGNLVKSYGWNYAGTNYRLDVHLDTNLNSKYYASDTILKRNHPQPGNLEDEYYYSEVAKLDPSDRTIDQLAKYFENLAKAKNLSSDQEAEIIIAWLQSIPSHTLPIGCKRPYQTLKDRVGDCDDKSVLGYDILKARGFGCSLILYADHMAIGLATNGYKDFNGSGFCYTEVNPKDQVQIPIGSVPIDRTGLSYKILLKTAGKAYNGRTAV